MPARWQACGASGNATRFGVASKRKLTRAWTVYKLAKVGQRPGTVCGETEKEALANAQKEFAKSEAEKKTARRTVTFAPSASSSARALSPWATLSQRR